MQIIETAQNFLETAGYLVRKSQVQDAASFEDPSLFGFLCSMATIKDFHNRWRSMQDKFLQTNAERIRKSPLKSWNAYSVFLTESSASEQEKELLLRIEEDFQGTRKIVGLGLRTPGDVQRALLPLLPVQNWVVLRRDDPIERLRKRLGSLPAPTVELILGDARPGEIVERLLP